MPKYSLQSIDDLYNTYVDVVSLYSQISNHFSNTVKSAMVLTTNSNVRTYILNVYRDFVWFLALGFRESGYTDRKLITKVKNMEFLLSVINIVNHFNQFRCRTGIPP